MMPHSPQTWPPELEHWFQQQRENPPLLQAAVTLLAQMVEIDTTPTSNLSRKIMAEQQVFDLIRTTLHQWAPMSVPTILPIRPSIANAPRFTRPYYAAIPESESPTEMVERIYHDRGNLLVRWGDESAGCIGFNAHIDTVSPHLPPLLDGTTVTGRGAADDKGACLTMMLVLRHLTEIQRLFNVTPARGLKLAFVIDEEPGGNGSLSLADEPAAICNPLIVLECTDLDIHPGNRGAVWYEIELTETPRNRSSRPPIHSGDALLEAAAFIIGQLEQCGRQLKQESDHPLFPHRPVQTCHGRLGTWGEHPSRVCDKVALELHAPGLAWEPLQAAVETAVREYCQQYGDKTVPGTGDRVLERHLQWSKLADDIHLLEIYGLAGHMGSVARLDGAITKAAAIIRALVKERQQRPEWAAMQIKLAHPNSHTKLTLEGGQGFVPTHGIQDVCQRMTQAARVGIRQYVELTGISEDFATCDVRFDKLHNDAFARPADGAAFLALRRAAEATGLPLQNQPRGWDVSCDARIFACQWPNAEIITFGPGHLSTAHSNTESLDVRDALQAAETLTRFVLGY